MNIKPNFDLVNQFDETVRRLASFGFTKAKYGYPRPALLALPERFELRGEDEVVAVVYKNRLGWYSVKLVAAGSDEYFGATLYLPDWSELDHAETRASFERILGQAREDVITYSR